MPACLGDGDAVAVALCGGGARGQHKADGLRDAAQLGLGPHDDAAVHARSHYARAAAHRVRQAAPVRLHSKDPQESGKPPCTVFPDTDTQITIRGQHMHAYCALSDAQHGHNPGVNAMARVLTLPASGVESFSSELDG